MVKEPRPGRVKTRLGREIGYGAAAWWFRHQTRGLLRGITDPRWRVVLAVSPDREGLGSRVWPAGIERWPQGPGDLGARMSRMMRRAAPGPVLVIGADIPGIGRNQIRNGFGALQGADAVIGPAPDGGYWMVGVSHPARLGPKGLTNVRWSSPNALKDTLASLSGLRVSLTQTLADVDTAQDLDRHYAHDARPGP